MRAAQHLYKSGTLIGDKFLIRLFSSWTRPLPSRGLIGISLRSLTSPRVMKERRGLNFQTTRSQSRSSQEVLENELNVYSRYVSPTFAPLDSCFSATSNNQQEKAK
jgi:hypothetical protein